MEVFNAFFFGTLGVVAGLTVPGIVTVVVGAFIAAVAAVVTKND